MRYINYTPHAIVLNDSRVFEPSGSVARVSASYSTVVDDVCKQVFGEVEGLPYTVEGVTIIKLRLVGYKNKFFLTQYSPCDSIKWEE